MLRRASWAHSLGLSSFQWQYSQENEGLLHSIVPFRGTQPLESRSLWLKSWFYHLLAMSRKLCVENEGYCGELKKMTSIKSLTLYFPVPGSKCPLLLLLWLPEILRFPSKTLCNQTRRTDHIWLLRLYLTCSKKDFRWFTMWKIISSGTLKVETGQKPSGEAEEAGLPGTL